MSSHARLLALAVVASLAAAPAPLVAQSRDPGTYVLLGGEVVRANGLVVTSGDVGVNAGVLVGRRGIDAPASQLVADVLRVSDDSSCAQAFANSVVGTGPLCGPATSFESPILPDLAAACGFPEVFPECDSANALTVEAGVTQQLPPGAYGEVRVLGGADSPGMLVLDGGDYAFCTLRLTKQGRLAVAGPSTVHVAGVVTLARGASLAPADGTDVAVDDIRLFAAGSRVRVGREAALRALACIPDGVLSAAHGAMLEGRFVARSIRTGRATAAHVAVPTTTTTTLPVVCGDGVVNGDEQCDPPESDGCPGGAICSAECTCPPPPSTTSTSTTTTLPVCGDGFVNGSEECDPSAGATCAAGASCGAAGQPGACTCVPVPVEICGNCADDDGNGLIDFEDAACCELATRFPLALTSGRIKSQGLTTSRLALRGLLAPSGLENVDPLRHDVLLQLRPEGGTDLLCARLPASSFRKVSGGFRFRDRARSVAGARALQKVVLKVRSDGGVVFTAQGTRVQMRAPRQGRVQLTVGLEGASAAQNQCSTGVVAFRPGPQGRLVAP